MKEARTFSGFLGLVLLPIDETAQLAAKLAREYAPDAAFRVAPEGAHLTLYQAQSLTDVNEAFVQKLIVALQQMIGSREISLQQIAPAHETYLFWNVVEQTSLLIAAHYAACSLALFLDPARERHRPGNGLTPAQDAYADRFGHALVGPEYRPHVTLAADPKGFSKRADFWNSFRTRKVALARMGEWGRLEEVLL